MLATGPFVFPTPQSRSLEERTVGRDFDPSHSTFLPRTNNFASDQKPFKQAKPTTTTHRTTQLPVKHNGYGTTSPRPMSPLPPDSFSSPSSVLDTPTSDIGRHSLPFSYDRSFEITTPPRQNNSISEYGSDNEDCDMLFYGQQPTDDDAADVYADAHDDVENGLSISNICLTPPSFLQRSDTHEPNRWAEDMGHTVPPNGDNVTKKSTRSAKLKGKVPPAGLKDVICMTDDDLRDHFYFHREIGFGNWGSVWMCKLRGQHKNADDATSLTRLGYFSANGSGATGRVAIKLVRRERSPVAAQRVRALWGEMKIIRSLRHEPHPSIIQFEAFVITDSYAILLMPYHSHLIPVQLGIEIAVPYFHQLASGVSYLHERGITHNDIKPANVLISHSNIPVLVDFGFATYHEPGPNRFLSKISWGTPEYLDPQRAKGLPHDERDSDVWALGVTMFEVLVGRTPFEANEEEQFETSEQLLLYHERTKRGEWMGEWDMPKNMESLLRFMICPDPSYRLTAFQAYQHEALRLSEGLAETPNFVRETYNQYQQNFEPVPPVKQAEIQAAEIKARKLKKAKSDIRRRKKRNADRSHASRPGTPTPPALVESRKQPVDMELQPTVTPTKTAPGAVYNHESRQDENKRLPSPVKTGKSPRTPKKQGNGVQTPTRKGVDTKQVRPTSRLGDKAAKQVRPASRQGAKEQTIETRGLQPQPRVTDAEPTTIDTREAALHKTLKSLEGVGSYVQVRSSKHFNRTQLASEEDVNATFGPLAKERHSTNESKHSPERPARMEVLVETGSEETPPTPASPSVRRTIRMVGSPNVARRLSPEILPFKTTSRMNEGTPSKLKTIPTPMLDLDIESGELFPSSFLRSTEGTENANKDASALSGDTPSPPRKAKESTAPSALGIIRPVESQALDHLDRLADWIKNMDRFVEEARKAVSEGKDTALISPPPMPEGLETLTNNFTRSGSFQARTPRSSGGSYVIPSPRAWQPAECEPKAETITIPRQGKKERPTVSQIFRAFTHDKVKEESAEPARPRKSGIASESVSNTLRGAPSTPRLRYLSGMSAYKSESNLRIAGTVPAQLSAATAVGHFDSTRTVSEGCDRVEDYNDADKSLAGSTATKRLTNAPGVVRRGHGWAAADAFPEPMPVPVPHRPLSGAGRHLPHVVPGSEAGERRIGKPTSMVSLREKALALISSEPRNDKPIVGSSAVANGAPATTGRLMGRKQAAQLQAHAQLEQVSTSQHNHHPSCPCACPIPHQNDTMPSRPVTPGGNSLFSTTGKVENGSKRASFFKLFGRKR